ncbi:Phosphoribosylaminoimidazole-succinocarboxamide synthase [Candidatus Erwinia haradaeae]|uniref:Phosphoribosylaminoimidazole-succinocarboxamide synthase n=1 Tax=Candidatus Erwinia haradaeae TaxID=1922217 RepID=A0A451DIS6_9GAMM|nr:phosphoribosylaminoimidazolesuccinocarboxamide synthase [Candidatus Erwinia haradaeae]VFP86610.1 Phosphoribosylaminoimidazole-succinocarboxamide synthase [Candidatus Erwinia haradaeae]
MRKIIELYRGKTKTLYSTDNPNLLVLEFRDDVSALDGQRIDQFYRKGLINNKLNYFIMSQLQEAGIPTQIEALYSHNAILVKNLEMVPLEFVLRNRAAGSLVKRLGIEEGVRLCPPLFDLFLKNDSKRDPMINSSYCETFGWVSKHHLSHMREITFQSNEILKKLFSAIGFILVDFKLEFGIFNNQVMLGDEFSPDSARLWDAKTLNKMDKDLYRQNRQTQVGLIEAYEEVANRLGVKLD